MASARVFQYSASAKKGVVALAIGAAVLVAYALAVCRGSLFEQAAMVLGMGSLVGFLLLLTFGTRVTLDDRGITAHTPFSTRTLRWSEVDDFVASDRLLLLTGKSGAPRLCFHWLERRYGLALEPQEELWEEVRRWALPPLLARWAQVSLQTHRTYLPAPFGLGQAVLYALPVEYVLLFLYLLWPFAATVREAGLQIEMALLLVGAVLPVASLFWRDVRRARRPFHLEPGGVREGTGRTNYLPWTAITRIVTREPALFGYGSVTVVAANGRQIKIRRSIARCGELLYLITSRTQAVAVESCEC